MKGGYTCSMLWFDVGIKRYTTLNTQLSDLEELWFDVGIKRYTTSSLALQVFRSCGLM